MSQELSKQNKSLIITGSIQSIADNVCKSSRDENIENVIVDSLKELMTQEDFKDKMSDVLLESVKRVVLDLNGNKVLLAHLLVYKPNTINNAIRKLFDHVLRKSSLKEELDKKDRRTNEQFTEIFVSNMNDTLNTMSELLRLIDSGIIPTSVEGKEMKGGNTEKNLQSLGQMLNKMPGAAEQAQQAQGPPQGPPQGGSSEKGGGLFSGISNMFSRKKDACASVDVFKGLGFDFQELIHELGGMLKSEIATNSEKFYDRLTAGISFAMSKSKNTLIHEVIKSMGSGFNTINLALDNDPTVGTLFLYQLLSYEVGALGEAFNRVADKYHEQYKLSKKIFTYKVVFGEPTFIDEVCISMRNSLLKQLEKEYDAENLARHRKKVIGGGGKKRTKKYTKKRIMKKRNIKRYTRTDSKKR
jgi:hypothetical protein